MTLKLNNSDSALKKHLSDSGERTFDKHSDQLFLLTFSII